ncbi:MAG: undecaprenyldiphospho-muramoylpentapeptide beta-N-acetylglucosaminyltransferase [Bacillota bacterium]
MLTGGGTGGHIYPALALARHIRRVNPGAELLFVGAAGGMEEKLIPQAGFPLETLTVKGLPRKLNYSLLQVFFLMGKAAAQAGKILEGFRPDFVVGTGGYAAAPLAAAALRRRIKVLIHEQNVLPGLTNRLLAPWVYKVCLSFEASRRYFMRRSNLCLTGNPRASEVGGISKEKARQILNMDPHLPFLLAVGGSQGAAVLNQSMMDFLFLSSAHKKFQVLYVTGERYYEEVNSRLRALKIPEIFGGRLQLRPYQQEMPLAMAAADLMITRAGATTIAEITALGLPALIVPSPNVAHNHQLINGLELSHQGAAVLLEEKELNGRVLQQAVYRLFDTPGELAKLSENSRRLGHPGAADCIYRLMVVDY